LQILGTENHEERIAAIRRQIRVEIMDKMQHDRSSGAISRAKAEAEAKAKCAACSYTSLHVLEHHSGSVMHVKV
jgi:hypothetical protein